MVCPGHEAVVIKQKELEIELNNAREITDKNTRSIEQITPAVATLPEIKATLDATCRRVTAIEKELTGNNDSVGLKHTVNSMADDITFLRRSFNIVIIVGVLICLCLTGREELVSLVMKFVR